MVQQVLDLPELKIAKPSDTCWLTHERCVKAVKASYGAIVTDIHENTHESEVLGLGKALTQLQLCTCLTTLFLRLLN